MEYPAFEESYLRSVVQRFLKHKLAVTGLVIIVIMALLAIFAPIIAPMDPNKVTSSFEAAPSSEYWLGTDQIGRDVLSRLIYATRVSLMVGAGSVVIGISIGTIMGLLSGYFGGWVDMLIMRVTDVFMSFPQLMLILVVVSVVGPGLMNVILVLGFLGWTGSARLVRGNTLSLKQMDYVKAGVALGLSTPRILFVHILPNTIAPILVNATFWIAGAITTEAALSFLGLGVRPPTASWGNMLTEAQSLTVLTSQPWLWIPAGLMIVIAVLAVNFIGDGLRDAVDPKSLK
ncbi:ABC transporter permease [Paenibacillus sp. WQ 127069]|uniref:ABC transporter permease n=1 Tax=Paenibacillus baimaensis TaxID=2982185 RepID=A0ABT2UGD5_9BACL|nr:oligopeptide ABC transporter permease [Paenibacillus sp. WQ 127069]MCU6793703.1 ABC transporter permease [Paenibacillus sp. WQ 127069]